MGKFKFFKCKKVKQPTEPIWEIAAESVKHIEKRKCNRCGIFLNLKNIT